MTRRWRPRLRLIVTDQQIQALRRCVEQLGALEQEFHPSSGGSGAVYAALASARVCLAHWTGEALAPPAIVPNQEAPDEGVRRVEAGHVARLRAVHRGLIEVNMGIHPRSAYAPHLFSASLAVVACAREWTGDPCIWATANQQIGGATARAGTGNAL